MGLSDLNKNWGSRVRTTKTSNSGRSIDNLMENGLKLMREIVRDNKFEVNGKPNVQSWWREVNGVGVITPKCGNYNLIDVKEDKSNGYECKKEDIGKFLDEYERLWKEGKLKSELEEVQKRRSRKPKTD